MGTPADQSLNTNSAEFRQSGGNPLVYQMLMEQKMMMQQQQMLLNQQRMLQRKSARPPGPAAGVGQSFAPPARRNKKRGVTKPALAASAKAKTPAP